MKRTSSTGLVCAVFVVGTFASLAHAQVWTDWSAVLDTGMNGVSAAALTPSVGPCMVVRHQVSSSPSLYDLVMLQYAADGSLVWGDTYDDGGIDARSKAHCIVADQQGNAYVGAVATSISELGEVATDYALFKYDSAGRRVWTRVYNGPGNRDDAPTTMAVDRGGNILVAGKTFGVGISNYDCTTLKYDPDGNLLWSSTFVGSGNAFDIPISVVTNAARQVAVLTASGNDTRVIEYDSNGNQLWVAAPPKGTAIGLGEDGSVCVAAPSYASGVYSVGTWRYDPAGALVWTATYPTTGNTNAGVFRADVDESGSARVVAVASTGCVILDYTPSGVLARDEVLIRPGFNGLTKTAPVLDPDGNVYLVGTVGVNYVCYIFKFGPGGEFLWQHRFDVDDNFNDLAMMLKLGMGREVYVVGVSDWTEYSDPIGNLIMARIGQGVTGDTNRDEYVDFLDIAQVIEDWGPHRLGWAADLNGDGSVGMMDLVLVLTNFGTGE
jgi:hypothetical protein